jgi:hypothetical protein
MPSKHTTAAGKAEQYSSEAEKMLDRERQLIYALIKGMDDDARIQEWLETEAQGRARKDIIAALNKKREKL